MRMPRFAGLIRAVDLLPTTARPIKCFSTGMTTRLGIAASLMNAPNLHKARFNRPPVVSSGSFKTELLTLRQRATIIASD